MRFVIFFVCLWIFQRDIHFVQLFVCLCITKRGVE